MDAAVHFDHDLVGAKVMHRSYQRDELAALAVYLQEADGARDVRTPRHGPEVDRVEANKRRNVANPPSAKVSPVVNIEGAVREMAMEMELEAKVGRRARVPTDPDRKDVARLGCTGSGTFIKAHHLATVARRAKPLSPGAAQAVGGVHVPVRLPVGEHWGAGNRGLPALGWRAPGPRVQVSGLPGVALSCGHVQANTTSQRWVRMRRNAFR